MGKVGKAGERCEGIPPIPSLPPPPPGKKEEPEGPHSLQSVPCLDHSWPLAAPTCATIPPFSLCVSARASGGSLVARGTVSNGSALHPDTHYCPHRPGRATQSCCFTTTRANGARVWWSRWAPPGVAPRSLCTPLPRSGTHRTPSIPCLPLNPR